MHERARRVADCLRVPPAPADNLDALISDACQQQASEDVPRADARTSRPIPLLRLIPTPRCWRQPLALVPRRLREPAVELPASRHRGRRPLAGLGAAEVHECRLHRVQGPAEADTPAALQEVAQMHRLDETHWRLLRPGDADVRTLAAVLDIRYRAQPDGTFNHTSALILLDSDGRILARSEVTGLQPDAGFVDAVREHLAAPATASR
ncbi:MAG TPA: hypothetical protein VGD42_20605 [Lysobacter sp.]